MAAVITIPKELSKEGDLIVMPRSKYEEFLKLIKRFGQREWEEKDTDEAIRIFKKEKKEKKLIKIRSLTDLG
ncbi:MAG: hypothetical protein AAB451_03460 [Patescibacteria group bacterium]